MRGEALKHVTDITVSDNNTLIFCDVSTSKVYFCDEHDTYQSSISSPYEPYDISAIPGTRTAVMSGRFKPSIQFLDIERRIISKTIEVKHSRGYGVDATKTNIFVGTRENIQVLDLSGNILRTVRGELGHYSSGYISVCPNGNICFSNETAVHCITLDECPVFSYSSSDLRSPRNSITDDVGNIYVLDSMSQSIHQLTSTGTLVVILLKNSLSKPNSFCFNKDLSKCYIANKSGKTISVFKTN